MPKNPVPCAGQNEFPVILDLFPEEVKINLANTVMNIHRQHKASYFPGGTYGGYSGYSRSHGNIIERNYERDSDDRVLLELLFHNHRHGHYGTPFVVEWAEKFLTGREPQIVDRPAMAGLKRR
jgi:hypothetical protein